MVSVDRERAIHIPTHGNLNLDGDLPDPKVYPHQGALYIEFGVPSIDPC